MKSDHNVLNQSCNHCEYQTAYSEHLKRPIQSKHEGVKKFKCSQCNFTCNRNDNLKQHIQARHEGIKRIVKCSQCDIKFFT